MITILPYRRRSDNWNPMTAEKERDRLGLPHVNGYEERMERGVDPEDEERVTTHFN